MIRLSIKRSTYANLALALLFLYVFSTICDAQRRTAPRIVTDLDDVVFAVSFSPDGGTLAIAREPVTQLNVTEESNSGTLKPEACGTLLRDSTAPCDQYRSRRTAAHW